MGLSRIGSNPVSVVFAFLNFRNVTFLKIERFELMSTLAECLQEKEYHPERMLVISVEDTREKGNYFWSSIPVKSTLPKNVILHRIILDEDMEEFESFSSKYEVSSNFSLYVFGPHSTIISHMWTEGFPEPAEFAEYISGTQVGAYTFDDQQQTIENMKNDVHNKTKKVKISIRTRDGAKSHTFNETDTVADLNMWLDAEVGPGNKYTISHTNEELTSDLTLSLKEAGLAPSALLRIKEGEWNQNARPTGPAPVNTTEGCCGRFLKKALFVLSFINPFADEGDQESFWEYQPSNNPDIAQVVMRNTYGL